MRLVHRNSALSHAFQELAAWVEHLEWEEIENVDCQEGVLVIELIGDESNVADEMRPLTRTIVINKHYVNKQLWYSCPISGGDYFPFSNGWNSLRSNVHIKEKLKQDLAVLTGRQQPK